MSALLTLARPEDADGAPFDPRAWQSGLAGLLARLDHARSELAGHRLGADAGWLLDRAEEMIAAAETFAHGAALPARLANTEAEAVARAGKFLTTAHGVRETLHKGLFRSVLSTLTGTTGSGVAPAVRGALEAAAETLGSYFTLFTERFGSSIAARGWVEAATAFLMDFRELIRDLPE